MDIQIPFELLGHYDSIVLHTDDSFYNPHTLTVWVFGGIMKKTLVSILSILMFTNAFAAAANVKLETLKEDRETLMSVLEKGQCGQVCVRYERNVNGSTASSTYAFGFCRVSVTVCKD
jgi:hypothetical protein